MTLLVSGRRRLAEQDGGGGGSRGPGPNAGGIIAFAPGFNAAEQGTDASEAFLAKNQRGLGAGLFIRAVAIDDDLAVARKFMMTFVQIFHGEMDRAANDGRVLFQFEDGTNVEDDGSFAGVEHLAEFIGSNFGHTQFVEQAAALPIFEGDVEKQKNGDDGQETAAKVVEGGDDLGDLVAEGIAEENETAAVEERTETIEPKKLGGGEAGHAGERGRDGAHAGNEFGGNDAAPAIAGEDIDCLANAGVRLQGQAAQEAQHLRAPITAEVEPEKVGDEAGEDGEFERHEPMEFADGGERARGQEPGHGGNGHAQLV